MSASSFTTKDSFREEQKKFINNWSRPKPKKVTDNRLRKQKYWCSVYSDWYLATPNHTICKMCDGTHEVIKFDRKKHEL